MKATKSHIYATRARQTKRNAWMPETCIVGLDGRPGKTGLLLICGWSVEPDDKGWPAARLATQLAYVTKQWTEQYGKGWKLEIRSS